MIAIIAFGCVGYSGLDRLGELKPGLQDEWGLKKIKKKINKVN